MWRIQNSRSGGLVSFIDCGRSANLVDAIDSRGGPIDSAREFRAMKEKINEYAIDRPLDGARRKKIEQFIEGNAERLGRAISHEWDETGRVLSLVSEPVLWEFVFHNDRVESHASAPLWMKMLFTEKVRKRADAVVLQMLQEAGFIGGNERGTTDGQG